MGVKGAILIEFAKVLYVDKVQYGSQRLERGEVMHWVSLTFPAQAGVLVILPEPFC